MRMPARDWFLSFVGGLATSLALSGLARIAFEAAGKPSPTTGPLRGLWAAQEFALALGAIAVLRAVARKRRNPKRFLAIYAALAAGACALISLIAASPA